MEDKKKSGDSLWNSVVQQVKMLLPTEIERNRMDRYFPLMHSPRLEENCYVIEVGEQIQVEMFAKLYSQLIQEALQSGGLNVNEVRFIVSKDLAAQQQQPAKYRPAPTTPQRGMPSTMPMHENYTFENFVKGPSNSFAHAAATAVAKGPGRTSYNPLFIYGGTGLGKTHLMEAIGHYVLDRHPEMSVCYITSETFLNEYVNALQNDETSRDDKRRGPKRPQGVRRAPHGTLPARHGR